MVRVKPHLLELIRRQRPRFLPDPRVDGHSSEVMDERRAANGADAGVVEPATPRRGRRKLRHARRVTGQIRRHQIGEVAHGRQRAIERFPLEQQRRLRFAGERLLPHRPRSSSARIRAASPARQAATSGSNACPWRSRTRRTTRSSPPSSRWKAASTATWTIRIGSGISSPFARPSGPCRPSARSGRRAGPAPTGRGPTLSASIPATSHAAARCRTRLPRHPRKPACNLERAHRPGASGVGKRADQTAQDLAARPVHDGVADASSANRRRPPA